MNNLKVRRVRDNIIALLNGSELDAETKRLITLEVYNLATKAAEEAVASEAIQEREEANEDDKLG